MEPEITRGAGGPNHTWSGFLKSPTLLAVLTGLYPFVFFIQHNPTYIPDPRSLLATLAVFLCPPLILSLLLCFGFSRVSSNTDVRNLLLLSSSLFWVTLFLNVPIKVLFSEDIPDLLPSYAWAIGPMKELFSQNPQLGLLLVLLAVQAVFLGLLRQEHYVLTVMLLVTTALASLGLGASLAFNPSLFEPSWINPTWTRIEPRLEGTRFKTDVNVYYIQLDGYASPSVMSDLYNIDNREMEDWLKSNRFSLYRDSRSNYTGTLRSNAPLFSMKHHYLRPKVSTRSVRQMAAGQNNVVRIFRRNNYRTTLLSRNDYLLRDGCAYDDCSKFPIDLFQPAKYFLLDGVETTRKIPDKVVFNQLMKTANRR